MPLRNATIISDGDGCVIRSLSVPESFKESSNQPKVTIFDYFDWKLPRNIRWIKSHKVDSVGWLSTGSIRKLEQILNFVFPDDFEQFLLFSNGAKGVIANDYIELWSIEEIDDSNRAIEISKFAPGLIAFAGDGANELFAFDTRKKPCTIVQIPMIGMELNAIWECADTFDHFLRSKLGIDSVFLVGGAFFN